MAVDAGTREDVDIPVERLASGPWISLPAIVLHGRTPGPSLWVSAALHGDEINGVEIIRRVLGVIRPEELSGTIVLLPVMNMLGFMAGERYLPDRRDLNRAFPGSARGSLAARIAALFMTEVVSRCDYGIDLHTGSDDRTNLAQIRCDLSDPETRRCAAAFDAPVIVNARTRDGSLREAATNAGVKMLLFEGGQAHRYDEEAITIGFEGILRVCELLGMVSGIAPATSVPTVTSYASRWVRASRAGLLRREVPLGAAVSKRQVLGHLSDIYGRQNLPVRASVAGMVIGARLGPRVNQGDALFHIATLGESAEPVPAEEHPDEQQMDH